KVSLVADLPQGRRDGAEIGVAVPRGPAVRIGELDVTEERAPESEGLDDIPLFDIHVEEIGQDRDVPGRQRSADLARLADGVDDIALVPIEGLEEKCGAAALRALAELFERVAEVPERGGSVDLAAPASLHRSQDRGRAEASGKIDDPVGKLPRV